MRGNGEQVALRSLPQAIKGTSTEECALTVSATRRSVMLRYVLPLAMLAATAVPALSAEYFVVRDPSTKTCKVVETRPTDKTIVVMGDKAFVTREEAEK